MGKNKKILLGFVVSVSLMASMAAAAMLSYCDRERQFALLNTVCERILEQEPGAEEAVFAALKGASGEVGETSGILLETWGYKSPDFMGNSGRMQVMAAAAGVVLGALLFFATLFCQRRKEALRLRSLADHLEQVNLGTGGLFAASGEDDFSKLEDEIYKTVTSLNQARDAAVQARNGFAENLSNIAHQIKTPITAISLSVQRMGEGNKSHKDQIRRQLARLTRLEEALLVLSRLDAGALSFQRKETDVFTLLVLAADNLEEFFRQKGVTVEVPENGEMALNVDPEWTMEALMNLMKNCLEHSERQGSVRCSYTQNPLYTQILIWDEGRGFSKEDLPHLFERFYRGKDAKEGGIGIGLSLSREIIERQNGTIRAGNRAEGGACFEIRFYRH